MKRALRLLPFSMLALPAGAGASVEEFVYSYGLGQRAAALNGAPYNSFAYEVRRMLPRSQSFTAVEKVSYDDKPPPSGLSSDVEGRAAKIVANFQTTREYTLEDGAGLPDDVRIYVAGAAYWTSAVSDCPRPKEIGFWAMETLPRCANYDREDMEEALTYFEDVLSLPEDDAILRGAWAAYMVGQVHSLRAASLAGTAKFAEERDAAAQAFREVRRRVANGASDTHGLAVASLGEEARLYLYADGAECNWRSLRRRESCVPKLTTSDLEKAIELYVQQAAYGSRGAVDSLGTLSRALLVHPDKARDLAALPIPQRVFTAYVTGVVSLETEDRKPDPRFTTYMAALADIPRERLIGMDRLAALAYRVGDYSLAEDYVEEASGPMAHWIRAKLALRKGKRDDARTEYAAAISEMRQRGGDLQDDSAGRLTGERTMLELAQGEYLEAFIQMRQLAQGRSSSSMGDTEFGFDGGAGQWDSSGTIGTWAGAGYLAERVLTLDEFKAVVDAQIPASLDAGVPSEAKYGTMPFDDDMRWILARRLMRAGRYGEAIPYFPLRANGQGLSDEKLYPRQLAKNYVRAIASVDEVEGVEKARRLFALALQERHGGMELLGYESSPDFAGSGGSYEAPDRGWGVPDDETYVSDIERKRFDESQARPLVRFTYRYRAADHAFRAADFLPPRSQAFAAILCTATRWMMDGPPGYEEIEREGAGNTESARRIKFYYERYKREGKHFEWAKDFGRHCPDPDFAAADRLATRPTVGAPSSTIGRTEH